MALQELRLRPQGHEIAYFLLAVGLTAYYLVTTLYLSAHRLLWFDEILTVHIARLPHWSTIWSALGHASDTQPPVYYIIVRFSEKIFGQGELADRLPSAMAMAIAMLFTFDSTRRLTNGLYGLIAVAVLGCSVLPYYGYEARPYTLFVMFSAVALWLWIRSGDDSRLSAALFGLAMFAGGSIHYYFPLSLVPYALWEAIRWQPWQRPSLKLMAGTAGAIIPVLLFSPLILSFSRQFHDAFWGHPSFWLLAKSFSDFFPNGLMLLAFVMVCLALLNIEQTTEQPDAISDTEILGWLFLSVPIVGFLIAEAVTKAFAPRYFIGALPGVAVAFACCLWRQRQRSRYASVAILAVLTAWGTANQWQVVRHPKSVDRAGSQAATRRYLSLEKTVHQQHVKHILFFDAMPYLEAQYYSKYPEECAMILLPRDEQPDVHSAHVIMNLSRYDPLQFWHIDELKQHASDTVLIGPTANTLKALEQSGFTLEVPVTEPWKVAYLH